MPEGVNVAVVEERGDKVQIASSAAVRLLLSKDWADPDHMIQVEVRECDILFTANRNGELVGICCAGVDRLPAPRSTRDVYMGLITVKAGRAGQGVADALARVMLETTRARLRAPGEKSPITYWGYSGNYAAYLVVERFLPGLHPSRDPQLDGASYVAKTLASIQAAAGFSRSADGESPFLFREVSRNRYREEGVHRIERFNRRAGSLPFSAVRLGRDLSDRVVMFAVDGAK